METYDNHKMPIFKLKDAVALISTIVVSIYLVFALSVTFKLVDSTGTPIGMKVIPLPPASLEGCFPGVEEAPTTVKKQRGKENAPPTTAFSSNQRYPFHGIIKQVAGRYQVDPHLIRAIILAESGYDPRARSKKGAGGLMQLMPSTAESLGVRDVYDPEQNIDGGVRYFRSLLDRFKGDIQLALAAYNAGSRHVLHYDGVPPFKATKRYIEKVLQFQEKFKTETDSVPRKLA